MKAFTVGCGYSSHSSSKGDTLIHVIKRTNSKVYIIDTSVSLDRQTALVLPIHETKDGTEYLKASNSDWRCMATDYVR